MLSRMYRTCLLTLGAWCCLSLMFSGLSFAQKCPKGKTRSVKICGNAKRDVIGCCKIPKRKKRKRRAKKKACLPGQVKTAETRGNCCYPGQYWSRARKQCMGTPSCPEELGMVTQGVGCGCPEGQEIGKYTDGHCCWVGQEWVTGRGCVGELSAEQQQFQERLAEIERAREARERVARIGIKWIKIPSGSFASGAGRYAGLRVKGFEMSKTEVTVGQYGKCVSAGVCSEPNKGGSCNWGKSGREDHPINCVDWGQARTFARWAGGDLPTEAEWEYAARGGGRDVKYPWGNAEASCSYAVMNDGGKGCGKGGTWSVCSKTRGNTPEGLCDMGGGVWEWVLDEYKKEVPRDGNTHVGQLPACNKTCDKGSSRRVYRGGSWNRNAYSLRVANRSRHDPGNRYDYLGFRLRRTIP